LKIPFINAITGGKVKVSYFDSNVQLTIPEGVSTGSNAYKR
jgi:DnaJ-class molecular chaperone